MRNNQFFRINQLATTLVNFLYILFFLLPFIIITAITILRGIKNYMEFPAIFVNGLIIILIIYPIHREYYYFQYGIIWFLALSSQLFSQFLTDSNPD
jgi:ammonia channel protein AmtB